MRKDNVNPHTLESPVPTEPSRDPADTPPEGRPDSESASGSDPLAAEIRDGLNQARKQRDKLRVTVLSSVLSDIRNREIEVGRELERDEIHEVLARGVKQRREAADQMREGGRDELAEKEEAESAILAEFLPPALEDSEVRAIVRELVESGVTDMGPLMGRLMPRLKGRFDGREANRIVREELNG